MGINEKKKLILRDGSLQSMQWRYEKHPNKYFYYIYIMKRNEMIGYVVFALSNNGKECSIYDFIIPDFNYFTYALNTFLKYVMHNKNVNSVRFVLNEGHPCIKYIKKTGFLKRKENTMFQVFTSSNLDITHDLKWFLSAGDKDV